MEDITLMNIWKAQEEKLDKTMQLNVFILESMQKQKAQSKLNSLVKFKFFAVIMGILWSLFLGLLIWGNQLQNIYFTVSIGLILLFNILAIAIYIKHICLIKKLDYSEPITDTQKKLSRLQASTFNARFLFLQTPFYTTWFWSTEMIAGPGIKFWLISVPIALLFSLLAICLYRNLTPENMHKKWVRFLTKSTCEHTSIMEAQHFLNEIEEFKSL